MHAPPGQRMSHVITRPPKRDHVLVVSYLYGAVVNYRPGETLGPRILTDYELVLIIDGHVVYRCDGTDHLAPPGTVILARPGFHESYLWDPKSETRHAYFHFNLDAIPRDWPPPSRWPIVVTNASPVIAPLFNHVVKCCNSHPAWPAERPSRDVNRMIEAMITEVLRGSHAAAAGSSLRPPPVQRALQWMREMLDVAPSQSIRLDDIAAAANVSPKHLCRLFQESLSCSPMRLPSAAPATGAGAAVPLQSVHQTDRRRVAGFPVSFSSPIVLRRSLDNLPLRLTGSSSAASRCR